MTHEMTREMTAGTTRIRRSGGALRGVLAAAVAAVSLGAVGVADAGAIPAVQWKLLKAPAGSPAKIVGTSCQASEAFIKIGRSPWGTALICNPYTASNGATKHHWSIWKYDPVNHHSCMSDGYFFQYSLVSQRSYWPSLCHQPTTGRLPYSDYVSGPPL